MARVLSEEQKKRMQQGRKRAAEERASSGEPPAKRKSLGSRTKAIHDRCKECVCAGPNNPGWMETIKKCDCDCALLKFRPYQ